jgi:hypothetical protein
MDRVGQILRALFRRALSEEARDPPALTDIIIERAHGRLEPRLGAQFSNGYLTWATLAPTDCYAFCERHAAWDLGSLRAALLREGHSIYFGMREEHIGELRRLRRRLEETERLRSRDNGATLLERLRREAETLDRDLIWQQRSIFPEMAASESEPRWRRPDPGRRLLQWWAHQREQLADSISFLRGTGEFGSKRAQDRGIRLLKENLDPSQRQQYDKHGFFDVTGGSTGKRYRIRHGRQMNIEQLDKNGRRVCGWCFFPQGNLVAGDIMLAQKMALELYEAEALRIANRY